MSHQFEFVEPLKAEYTCKVCKEPWNPDAVSQCKDCQASFCKYCHDEAVDKSSECLSCHKQPATFGNVHMLVRSMASNLKVYCRYKAHGCDWTGVRTAYPGHMEACPKKPKEFTYVDESAIPAELMCPICNTPFTEPVQLPCEHTFCERCIKVALAQNPQCPMDRKDFDATGKDLKPVQSIVIQPMLDELQVFCPHKDAQPNPCSWKGCRRDYKGHRAMCKAGIKATAILPPLSSQIKDRAGVTTAAAGESQSLQLTAIPEFTCYNGTAPFVVGDKKSKKEEKKEAGPEGAEQTGAPPTDPKEATVAPRPLQEEKGAEAGTIRRRARPAILGPKKEGGSDSEGSAEDPASPTSLQDSAEFQKPTGDEDDDNDKPQRMYVLAHLEAPELPASHSSRTKPLRLAIALDNSGSMGGDRIDSAKASVNFIVQQCTSQDSLGLVTFDSHVETVFPVMRMDAEGKAKALSLIEKISVRGCTNLSGGIEGAINLLVKDRNQKPTPTAGGDSDASTTASATDSINGVLAFTDGMANEGVTEVRQLCSYLQPKIHAANTVVHSFGFGANHSAKMLQNIAEIGCGSYYYVQSTESMKEHFADCLGGLMSTVAQNIQLTVKPQPGFIIDKVLSSLEVKSVAGTSVVTMRDLYSAEQRDVLVRLKMVEAQPVATQAAVATLTVAYDSLLTGNRETSETVCKVAMSSSRSTDKPHQKVREQKMRIRVTQVLKAATSYAQSGNYAAGRKLLTEAKVKLFPDGTSTPYEEELHNDIQMVLDGMKDQNTYSTYGDKVTSTITMTHTQQRSCTIASAPGMNSISMTRSYDTSAKSAMRGASTQL